MLAPATNSLAEGLSSAILDQNDPETVRQGAPSYLLLVDGLIAKNQKSESLLRSGATLYGSYASVFVEDEQRVDRMTGRAWDYARRALCLRHHAACNMHELPHDRFEVALKKMHKKDVPALYTYGVAWAGWIESHDEDWNAVANLPKVESVMKKVVELDESYEQGSAHMYLGVLYTLLPPGLGGKPDQAIYHFDRSQELSGGHNLMLKVVMAERYAKPLFKRGMHDRLLDEVLSTPAEQSGFTLMNVLAKERAQELLGSADEYF